ncbi:MAG: glycosyltransferase [Candidatus Dormibacteraeota bacterium]|nr:glycosyltransferase [Candidatus Dormibacteraeota bacterium]
MGEGHNATGHALEEAARGIWPGLDVEWVKTLDAMGPGVGPALRALYATNVERTPWLYELFYDQVRERRWFAGSSKRVIGAWAGRRLEARIAAWAPDAIISTYPMGTAGLAWLRVHRGLRTPIGAWVSDFAPHPFWVFREIDLTLVMHEVAVAPARGSVPGARVGVSAPPVRSRFRPMPRDDAQRALGLPDGSFVAVISGGSLGFGDVSAAAETVLSAAPRTVALVVCGHNARAQRELLREGDRGGRLRALGWVDDMPRLYAAADIVVTNAGGATALEALACGRGIVMYRPIAAHGRANAALMAEAGLAQVYDHPDQLRDAVRELSDHPERVAGLDRAACDYAGRSELADSLRAFLEAARER